MGRRKQDPDVAPRTPEEALIAALADMIGVGPIMVTAWVGFVEFIDSDGDMELHALGSDMPSWRAQGIIDAGASLLLDEESIEE